MVATIGIADPMALRRARREAQRQMPGGRAATSKPVQARSARTGEDMMAVRLQEITKDTVSAVCRLDAGDGGIQVAPNAVSIAQAHFEPAAWFRAIHADTSAQADALVGFVMLYDPTRALQPESPHAFLWRLMIDRTHQGAGHGAAAVRLVIDHARTLPGVAELRVSHVQAADRLARFYKSAGFTYTGEVDEGELVMALPLR